MKKRFVCMVLGLLLIFAAALGLAEGQKLPVTSLDRLGQPGIIIAVGLDTPAEASLAQDYPEAQIIPYSDMFLAYLEVAGGRIDACVGGRKEMEFAIDHGFGGVRLLEENYASNKIAVGISPKSAIPDLQGKLNAFIAEKKADGTLDEMYSRWVIMKNETMPEIPEAENPAFRLCVGTTGTVIPYSFYAGTELAGYDIELARRFASWLGAELELKVYNFGGIIPAAEAGSIDCIMSNLYYTEEKSEAIPFSDVLFEVEITAMVRDSGEAQTTADSGAAQTGGAVRWQDYNGKRLGVLTGPLMEDAAATYFPDSEALIFNTYPDCITALLSGRIDGYLSDELGVRAVHAQQPEVDYFPERLIENNYSFAFRKNDPKAAALCGELNEFLAASWSDGTIRELEDIWYGSDDTRKVVDMSGLTGENGTIRVVTTSMDEPFSYIKDGKNVGYDIDLVVRFCRSRGYALELGDVDFAGRIPAVESGKYDFTTDMNVTPEREEQVLFSDPTSKGGIVLAVRAADLSAPAAEAGVYTSVDQLSGKRIGVQTGTNFDEMVEAHIQDAAIDYYIGKADLVAALTGYKVDAFAVDEPVAQILMREDSRLTYLPECLDDYSFALVFAKSEAGEALRDEFNAFLAQLGDEALDALAAKWFGEDEDAKTMPDLTALKAEKGTLRVATEAGYAPFEYVRDGLVVGYDMELAALFCEACGYGLEIVDMNFDAILPSVQTGKCDFAAAGISVTPERAESVLFSEPNFSGGTVLVVLKGGEEANTVSAAQPEFTQFSDLSGRRVSMLTGAPFEELVRSKVPDVGRFTSFASMPDMLLALRSGKTDAVLNNNAIAALAVNRNPDLALFPQELQGGAFGFAFAKGDPRRDEWQAAFDTIPQAQIQAAWNRWTGSDESVKTLPKQDWPGLNGTVRVAACDTLEPMSYLGGGGELKGFDLEVILMIAKALDVRVEFSGMEFAAILSSVQSGKADIGAGSIIITEERARAVDFLEYHPAAFVLVVRAASASGAEAAAGDGFWAGIQASFQKTFIREGRWRLFVDGVATTLIITLLSILCGTVLGFLVFMLCRRGNPVANGFTRFSMWLVQGMPMVVLLMILYYIIFGSVAISGIAVAVIGFTLTFGAAVYGLLKMGVGAVDNGQYEAACALGYSSRRTFFRIILPQALPHVLPAYKGEIVGLIKATAIVGYIAVQDLTKMGDIVRSRTYEAFFPLIAVTVIYFILEGLIGFLVSRLSVSFNPKRRKPADILKGVKTSD